MTATSFRTDLRAGCFAVLEIVRAANTDKLSTIEDHPPESYNTPLAYVETAVREQITYGASMRIRVCTVNVVVLNKLVAGNKQVTEEQDLLVDLIIQAFTDNPHAASGSTEIHCVGVEPTVVASPDGGQYAGSILAIQGSVQEGFDT